MKRLLGAAALATAAISLTGTAAQAQPGLVLVTSPNVAKSDYNELDGVAAAGPASAWAVGFARHAQANCCAPFRALIEHWDGTAWSVKPAASLPSGDDTRLHALAVVSPADIWAVGGIGTPTGVAHSLIEHWNGTSWSVVPSPVAEPTGSVLAGVAAVSAADIWAVGSSNNGSGFSALIEHWNGTAWTVVPGAPLLGTGFNFLSSVAAVSPSDVWAVGRMFRHPTPVIEHWDGTSWTQVAQPVSGYDSSLNSISAAGASDIWAVGEQNLNQTVTEHWNGTAWTLVPSPTVTANNAQDTLHGVVALSGTDVWATGNTLGGFTTNTTLALHWNGTSWQIVPAADRGSDVLSSVAGAGPGHPLWAVGSTTGGTPITATLIETTTG
jgi:hypothetical protein